MEEEEKTSGGHDDTGERMIVGERKGFLVMLRESRRNNAAVPYRTIPYHTIQVSVLLTVPVTIIAECPRPC